MNNIKFILQLFLKVRKEFLNLINNLLILNCLLSTCSKKDIYIMKFGNSYLRLQNDDDLAAFQRMLDELETYSESLDHQQLLVKNECHLWISEKLNQKVEVAKELNSPITAKRAKKENCSPAIAKRTEKIKQVMTRPKLPGIL